MRFACIANPKASWFRENPEHMQQLYAVTSGRGILVTPEDDAALRAELLQIAEDDPEFLAVAGGDGTLSHFVTALLDVWDRDRLPDLALIHAGSMNTISKSLGSRGDPATQLEAIVKAEAGSLARTRRWTLDMGDGRYGFLFGAGIIPRYIEAFDAGGDTSPRKAATVLGRKVLDAVLGRGTDDFFARTRFDLYVDGRLLPLKEWLVVAAGTVDDLGLRFRPFDGLLHQPERMGVFASASTPATFATDLLPFRFSRQVRHSLAFHKFGRELRLEAAEPFRYNLDGELEDAGTSLVVRVGPPLTFLLPPEAKPPANELGP